MSPATITAYRIAVGGTRFITTNVTGVACFILLWFGKLDPGSFVTIIIATVAVFIGGETTERVKHGPTKQPDDVPRGGTGPGTGGDGV